MKPRVQWKRRTDFSEVAEALAIQTNWVFAMMLGERPFVIYTPGTQALTDEVLWSVYLKRDSSGVLVKDSVPRAHPDMWGRIEEILMAAEKEMT